MTERGTRIAVAYVNERFAEIRAEAGLPEQLTPHCLRHSYVTHLAELGWAAKFIQDQVGHSHAATTAIYLSVSTTSRTASSARRSMTSCSSSESTGGERRLRVAAAGADGRARHVHAPAISRRGWPSTASALSDSQVWRLVTGRPERLNLRVLVVLCEILGCEPGELVRRTEPQSRRPRSRPAPARSTPTWSPSRSACGARASCR